MEKLKVKLHDFVKSGERYLKTDTVYLARGTFWNMINQVTSAMVSIGLAVAVGHLVPKEAYGNYKYILSLSSLIGAFSLTGLNTAVIQAVARGFDGELREAFKINLKWSFGVIAVSVAGAIYYAWNENFMLSGALVLIGVLTPILNGAALYAAFLNGKRKFEFIAISNIWRNVIPSLFVLGTIFFTTAPLVLVFVYLLSYTLVTTFFYLYSIKKFEENTAIDPETRRYGIHLSAMSVLQVIAEQIDKIFIFQYFGGTSLAVYSFATAIPLQIKGVFKNIYQLILPKFAERPIKEIKRGMLRKILFTGTTIVAIVFLYVIVAPFMFDLLFPNYKESVTYSQVFALSLIPYVVIFPSAALYAHKAISELYRVNIYLSLIKVALVFLPIFFYGIWGAIVGKVAYEIISLAVLTFYFQKYSERNL